MQSTPPVDVPTPRTDAEYVRIEDDEDLYPDRHDCYVAILKFSRKLEQELIAATAELEHTKEQLRVAREVLSMVERNSSDWIAPRTAGDLLKAFTQPQSGAVDPVKGEEG